MQVFTRWKYVCSSCNRWHSQRSFSIAKVLYEFTISHLPNAAATIIGGTVTTGASTTSIPTSQFGIAAGSADQFKGRLIIFARFTTTAALRGQVAEITASTNSATPTLTVSPALTATPASGDTFIVI